MPKPKSETEAQKKARAIQVAEQVKLLFTFCMMIAQDKDLLEEVEQMATERASFALSAAPVLGALGMDYEEHELEASVRVTRTKALLNLIKALEDTEQARVDFAKKQASIASARAQLGGILGL